MIVIYYNIIIVIIYNIFKGESIVNFNEVLRQLRKGTIYTQEELANKLGLLRSTYAKYETGENEPDYKTLVKIANYYGVSTDVLLGRNVKENNNMYNSCEEIKLLIKKLGVSDEKFFDIENWEVLEKEDIEDIQKYFEWIVHKAREKKQLI